MASASSFLTFWLRVWRWLEWVAPEDWYKVGRQGRSVGREVRVVLLLSAAFVDVCRRRRRCSCKSDIERAPNCFVECVKVDFWWRCMDGVVSVCIVG